MLMPDTLSFIETMAVAMAGVATISKNLPGISITKTRASMMTPMDEGMELTEKAPPMERSRRMAMTMACEVYQHIFSHLV